MPTNIVIESTAMITMVAAAFRASGGLNAGTPLETASTPVIAVHPLENARSRSKSVSGWPMRRHRFDRLDRLNGSGRSAPCSNGDQRRAG